MSGQELSAWPTVEEVRATFSRASDRLAFGRMIAEVERAAAEKAWAQLAKVAYPLYEVAEAVLLEGADKQMLMGPLAQLGAQGNPYRRNEGENE